LRISLFPSLLIELSCTGSLVLSPILAAPSPPTWFKAFSASIFYVQHGKPPTQTRWFYASVQNCERFDTQVESQGQFFTITFIKDYDEETQWEIIYSNSGVTCYSAVLNGTLGAPNFSAFQYAGIALVNFVTSYHWQYSNASIADVADYYDSEGSREPVQLSSINNDGNRDILNFYEFDAGAQDPNLFIVPDPIKKICNPVSSRPSHIPNPFY